MSSPVNVTIIAEGASEQNFVDRVLAPYLAARGVYLHATQISKKGQKGGDVKFSRAKRDVMNFLKQRPDTYVSTFVDYYGVKEWPGLDLVHLIQQPSPSDIAKVMNGEAVKEIRDELPNAQVDKRYIPFTAVHEFEALLFSDAEVLAGELNIDLALVQGAIDESGSPERINNRPETSPSHRLQDWTDGHYAKASRGIVIAGKIGIEKMRSQCPNFHAWLSRLEGLAAE